MNQELAEQLKSAGFPDTKIVRDAIVINDEWFSPSLEVLIKECGEKFHGLWRMMDLWYAKSDIGQEIRGSTPEEAVAKLWLELNKKNDIIKNPTTK